MKKEQTQTQTPAQKLGYKLGDIFEVVTATAIAGVPSGSIIRFTEDDESNCPLFEVIKLPVNSYSAYGVGETYYENLCYIKKANISTIVVDKPLFNIHFTHQQAIDFIKKELQGKVSSFHSDFSVTISD